MDRAGARSASSPLVEGELQHRVGRNLRRYRARLRLTQAAFAERLQVPRAQMGGIERGERNLTLRSLERYADRLDVDPIDLLTE